MHRISLSNIQNVKHRSISLSHGSINCSINPIILADNTRSQYLPWNHSDNSANIDLGESLFSPRKDLWEGSRLLKIFSQLHQYFSHKKNNNHRNSKVRFNYCSHEPIGLELSMEFVQRIKRAFYCLPITSNCDYVNSMWNSYWNSMKGGEDVWYFVMARLKTDTFDFFTYWSRLVRRKEVILEFLCNRERQRYWTEQTKYAFSSNACEAGMKFLFPYFFVLVYKQSGKYTILTS